MTKKFTILFFFLFTVIPCNAGTIYVNWDGTGEYTTIQAGINAAVSGIDTVQVAEGTYYENINFYGKDIILTSSNPDDPNTVANTIIDANGSGHVVRFSGSETILCQLTGLTITGGDAKGPFPNNYGGGLFGYTHATISKCVITGNQADYGGGLYNCDGPITDCIILGNSANDYGGGLLNCDGPITNCTISGNSTSRYGGGLYGCDGPIMNCTISGNSTSQYGGGLHSCNGPITDCVISANNADFHGGGLYNCETSIKNSEISDNSADDGGGLYNCDGSITSCTISGNSANTDGGGLDTYSGSITNCTISGNEAGRNGGGLYKCNSSITNSIVWGNSAPNGNEIYNNLTTLVFSYCDIAGSGGSGAGWNAVLGSDAGGNIDADPLFVDTTSSDPNLWDYHLKSQGWRWDNDANDWTWDNVTSRCIDAGNPGSLLADEPMTLDVDPLNRWGENIRINMGAYGGTAKASMPPYDWALLADLTNDGIVNLEDFANQAIDWQNTADAQPGDLNRDGIVDLNDALLMANDWLKTTSWY